VAERSEAVSPTGPWLGIVELGEVCARMRARSVDAFEQLGTWVTSDDAATADGALRRLLAGAAHWHAWHAQLWAGRSPTIPGAAEATGTDRPLRIGPDVRAAYGAWLAGTAADLEALGGRVDPTLDPGTTRVIRLVSADIAHLQAGLAA
jgi:hypothetical protein